VFLIWLTLAPYVFFAFAALDQSLR
jgi:hypothetical protein